MYLERLEPEQNIARAYAVRIEPTLFGEWALIRQWGRINANGQRLEVWFDSWEAAERAAARLVAVKRRRGYVLRPDHTHLSTASVDKHVEKMTEV